MLEGGAWIARLDGPEQDAHLRKVDTAGRSWPALADRSRCCIAVGRGRPRVHRPRLAIPIFAGAGGVRSAADRGTGGRDLHGGAARNPNVCCRPEANSMTTASALRSWHMISRTCPASSHCWSPTPRATSANPEFQKDMIETVQSSVRKITALLARLEQPEVDRAPAALAPAAPAGGAGQHLSAGAARRAWCWSTTDPIGTVAMGGDAFETAVAHLLNNAVEASGRARR